MDGTDHFLTPGGYASVDGAQDVVVASRDEGINDALLAAAVERAHTRGFRHLRALVASGDEPFGALVERAGFAHESDLLRMWRRLDGDLPNPVWPADVSVRTYSDDDGVGSARAARRRRTPRGTSRTRPAPTTTGCSG